MSTSLSHHLQFIESTPYLQFEQTVQCSESSNRYGYEGLHMSTVLFYPLNVQFWGFYPCIASICQLFSRDGLGPCYNPRRVHISMYAIDCILLLDIVSRWGTATHYYPYYRRRSMIVRPNYYYILPPIMIGSCPVDLKTHLA